MKDSDHLAIWIYLLLHATHTDYPAMFKGQKITLKAGQMLTGRKAISEALSISESKTKRVLNEFESDHQIDRQRSNRNSLITILNWDMYQDSDQQNVHLVTSQRPASDQQVTTNKNVRMKECKNLEEKNIAKKEAFKKPTVDELKDFIWSKNYHVDAEAFYNYYESNGWKVGRNPMKSWQAALVTWERKEKEKGGSSMKPKVNWDEV